MIPLTHHKFSLNLDQNRILKIVDLLTNTEIEKFSHPMTSSDYKIYVVCDKKRILYIGTTKDPIKTRLRSGLTANGKNGYHGYKWKTLPKVTLFLWNFPELDQDQIESVEAELAFVVRKMTNKWPEFQNEIHFNNKFRPTGQLIAEKLYRQMSSSNGS